MDNLTHSLAGLMEAELVSETFKVTREQRFILLAIGVLANNFPDLDLLYADRIERPIGYLLHHRGHTHTLAGIVVGFLLVIAALFAVPKTRALLKQSKMLARVIFTLGLGLITHLLMDSWNSYGVHPLWPFSSKWFFGDAIFILEPVLWISLALPFLLLVSRRWFRYLLLIPIAGLPLLAFGKGLLTWYSSVVCFTQEVSTAINQALSRCRGGRPLCPDSIRGRSNHFPAFVRRLCCSCPNGVATHRADDGPVTEQPVLLARYYD